MPARVRSCTLWRMVINREAPEPLYEQLAELIRQRIRDGEWAPRTAIPSLRDLTEDYGLAMATVQKAIGVLVAEGTLITVKGRGTFVSG